MTFLQWANATLPGKPLPPSMHTPCAPSKVFFLGQIDHVQFLYADIEDASGEVYGVAPGTLKGTITVAGVLQMDYLALVEMGLWQLECYLDLHDRFRSQAQKAHLQ